MNKHKFNIYPEMQDDEFAELLADIKVNGYDESQPIYIYEGAILDGWNRQRACNELNVQPKYETFVGTNLEAIMFVVRTNKRRNLKSFQKACIAADADEIIQAITEQVEAERRQKIEGNNNASKEKTTTEIIPPSFSSQEKEANETRAKVAKMFDTNSRYVSDAIKLKESNPDIFEQAKAGNKTYKDAKNEQQAVAYEKKIQEADISERDKHLIEMLKNGETVVVNQKTDLATIRYAESKGIYIRADRYSDWGNPFEMGKDGNRDDVCNNYTNHYLPFKPSLLSKLSELKGKALGCWCAPERCHCDTLKNKIDANNIHSNS